MASLEQEPNDAVRSAQPAEQAGTSRDSSRFLERVPDEVWKTMSMTQKKNVLKRRKAVRTAAEPSQERKRGREEASTTPSPREDNKKKPKLDYSSAVRDRKVAVTHSDYPHQRLSEEQIERLMLLLIEAMSNMKPEEGYIGFSGYSVREGALVVNCTDEPTYNWFVRSIAGISPWEGIPLKTCDPKDLEGYKRICFFIPRPVMGVEQALNNIGRLNQGLQVSRWRTMGHKIHDSGIYFVMSIPESNYKVLEGKNMKMFHGFTTVNVKPLAAKEEKQEEAKKAEGAKEVDRRGKGGRGPVAGASGAESTSTLASTDTARQTPGGHGTGVSAVRGAGSRGSGPPGPPAVTAAPEGTPGKSPAPPRE